MSFSESKTSEMFPMLFRIIKGLATVVLKLDSSIYFINLYPVYSAIIGFPNTYPLDRDLSDGKLYPAFEQLGPAGYVTT